MLEVIESLYIRVFKSIELCSHMVTFDLLTKQRCIKIHPWLRIFAVILNEIKKNHKHNRYVYSKQACILISLFVVILKFPLRIS